MTKVQLKEGAMDIQRIEPAGVWPLTVDHVEDAPIPMDRAVKEYREAVAAYNAAAVRHRQARATCNAAERDEMDARTTMVKAERMLVVSARQP